MASTGEVVKFVARNTVPFIAGVSAAYGGPLNPGPPVDSMTDAVIAAHRVNEYNEGIDHILDATTPQEMRDRALGASALRFTMEELAEHTEDNIPVTANGALLPGTIQTRYQFSMQDMRPKIEDELRPGGNWHGHVKLGPDFLGGVIDVGVGVGVGYLFKRAQDRLLRTPLARSVARSAGALLRKLGGAPPPPTPT